jgi:hypothetical protein
MTDFSPSFSLHFEAAPRIDLRRLEHGVAMSITTVDEFRFGQPITVFLSGVNYATVEAAVAAFNAEIAKAGAPAIAAE